MARQGVGRLQSTFEDEEIKANASDLFKDRSSTDLPGPRMQLLPGPTLLGNNTSGASTGGGGLETHGTQSQTIWDDSHISSEDYDSHNDKLMERNEDEEGKLALVNWVRLYWPVTLWCIWLLPWALIFLHYLTARGCGLTTARPLMEGFGMCFPSSQNNTAWLLKLWDDQRSITNRSETPSSHIRTIMTSHLTMHNAELILQDQAGKLRGVFPNDNERQKVMFSLNKSIKIASNLTAEMFNFASKLCFQKDNLTHALDAFSDTYLKTITISNPGAVSLVSFLFPSLDALRLLNRPWLSPWLPEPQIYSFEMEAELSFRYTQLVNAIEEFIARLHTESPDIDNIESLENEANRVTARLQELQQRIAESDSSRRPWSSKSDKTLKLEQYQKLLKLTNHHLDEALDIAQVYKTQFSRLWNDLQPLGQGFPKRLPVRFASTGSLAAPESLLAQIQKVSFVSPRQSSSNDQDSAGSSVSNIPPNPSLFGPSLNIDDTWLPAMRSEIAKYCKEGKFMGHDDDTLYTICTIYIRASIMSSLDKKALSGTQTSWVVEMEETIEALEKERGWDIDGVIRVLERLVDQY